jgi:hypothetical protein
MIILFRIVPKFCFFFFVSTVHTKFAAGLPLRQMVIRWLFSAALISFGSLLFACATLTFIMLPESHLK